MLSLKLIDTYPIELVAIRIKFFFWYHSPTESVVDGMHPAEIAALCLNEQLRRLSLVGNTSLSFWRPLFLTLGPLLLGVPFHCLDQDFWALFSSYIIDVLRSYCFLGTLCSAIVFQENAGANVKRGTARASVVYQNKGARHGINAQSACDVVSFRVPTLRCWDSCGQGLFCHALKERCWPALSFFSSMAWMPDRI